jgi:hypothetical protein
LNVALILELRLLCCGEVALIDAMTQNTQENRGLSREKVNE